MLFFIYSIIAAVTENISLYYQIFPYTNKTLNFNEFADYSCAKGSPIIYTDEKRDTLISLMKVANIQSVGVIVYTDIADPTTAVQSVLKFSGGAPTPYNINTNPTGYLACYYYEPNAILSNPPTMDIEVNPCAPCNPCYPSPCE